MEFQTKHVPISNLALEAKLFVEQHQLFTLKPKLVSVAAVPFSNTIAGWLCNKDVVPMSMRSFAVEFFLGLYLRDVVMKRAPGTDAIDQTTGAPTRVCHSMQHTLWCDQVSRLVQQNLVFLDQFMYTYLCAATAGELRHGLSKAKGIAKASLSKWNLLCDGGVMSRSETQASFLKGLDVAQSSLYLDEADQLFRNYVWAGSYGGKKWADICTTGRDRATRVLDPVLFIDRVFDLKHNGGPMFDKNSIVRQEGLPGFLDAKFALTNDVAWNPWLKYLTKNMATALEDGLTCKLWHGGYVTNKEKAPTSLVPKPAPLQQTNLDLPVDPPTPHVSNVPTWTSVGETEACPKGHT